MDCQKLSLAFMYLWVGDSKNADEIAKDCMESLRSSITDIRDKVRKVKGEVEEEYLLPKALRDEGIDSEDLVKLALFELARRISMFSGENKVLERQGIKYFTINMGLKVVFRGYCEKCKGFRYSILDKGFVVLLDQLIYAEMIGGNEEEILNEVLKVVKSAGGGT